MARSTRLAKATLLVACLALSPAILGATTNAPVRLTILYDNNAAVPATRASWGFSCLVEAHGKTVLFDAGGKPEVMGHNLSALNIDASKIDAAVFSHEHGDHTSGFPAVRTRPGIPAYVPRDFHPQEESPSLSASGLRLSEVTHSVEILPGFRISDSLHGPPPEIALAVDSSAGLVVITGCAHPGIIRLLENLSERTGRPIDTVIGGFHLLKTPDDDVRAIIAGLRKMGVRRAGPTHCSGDAAIRLFREAFGPDFIACGTGAVIQLPAP